MARRWTTEEEKEKRKELWGLYIKENKTIGQISKILGIAESSVFDRMQRLGIPSTPRRKARYLNKKLDLLKLPGFPIKLAEFFGIMLGDGHINFYDGIATYQICIYINTITDEGYIPYVKNLVGNLFNLPVGCHYRKNKRVVDLSVSSVDLINYLKSKGLFSTNKVRDQVGVPEWIFKKDSYQKYFLRGFFDTDGSIYSLKFGVQMSFCNKSVPLLMAARRMLLGFGYHPSKLSGRNLYLTRRHDLRRYAQEVGFGNPKHVNRAKKFGVVYKGA